MLMNNADWQFLSHNMPGIAYISKFTRKKLIMTRTMQASTATGTEIFKESDK